MLTSAQFLFMKGLIIHGEASAWLLHGMNHVSWVATAEHAFDHEFGQGTHENSRFLVPL